MSAPKSKVRSESIGALLVKIGKLRRTKSNELLSQFGIHDGQDILLYHLHCRDGQTPSEFVAQMCVQHATISNMIQRMLVKKLVRKERDKTDQRVSRIFLAPKGREAVQHIVRIWIELEKKSLRGVGVEEESALRHALLHILKNLG